MTKIKRKQLALDIENAPDGEYGLPGKNIPDVQPGDVLEEAIDKIIETLDKMAPATPPTLDSLILRLNESLVGPSIGKLTTTGSNVSNIFKFIDGELLTYTTDGNPLNVLNRDGHFKFDESTNSKLRFVHIYNSNIKYVNVDYFDQLITPPQDNINKITDSTDGFNITIDINEFRDFYADDPNLAASASNFYNSIKCVSTVQLVTNNNSADTIEREVYLEYSQKGDFTDSVIIDSRPYNYRLEGNETPTIVSTPLFNYITPMTGCISGVMTLQTNDQIKISAPVDNSIKYYYPVTAAKTVVTATNDVSYTISGTFLAYSTVNVNNTHYFLDNQYYETINGNMTPYDIFSAGQLVNVNEETNYRIDTKSITRIVADVDKRLQSPVSTVDPLSPWNTPVSSTGLYYDIISHRQSLNVSTGTYRNALQVRNGKYEYPEAVNYNNYIDSNSNVGPNYTNVDGNFPVNDWRYIDIEIGSITNITSLLLTFGGATWTTKQPSGLIILLRIDGTSPTGGDGWLNCIAAYGGTGNPTGTNDPVGPSTARDAYVISSPSSSNNGRIRYITFGSAPKTGTVTIRVGIENNSQHKFETISIL